MKSGPKPQSAAVRRARGSSRRPVVDDAPAEMLVPGAMKAPSWLVGEGLQIWGKLSPVLAGAKLLTAADAMTFARYCRNFGDWIKHRKLLDKEGPTYSVQTASGVVHRARPEFLMADRLERQLLAAEDRFGLNPAERQRIFAARSASGVVGDLFADQPRREGDAAASAAEPARPMAGPIGLLN